MRIIKTKRYSQMDWNQQMQNMLGGAAEGHNRGADNKAAQYAQMVINLMNQGVPQQQAFERVMQQQGIGKAMQVFRTKVIAKIQELYTSQTATPMKSYDDLYSSDPQTPNATPI